MCITGYFDSNNQAARLSKAAVFKRGRVPVIGRFSLPGGNPYVSDTPASVRGMGLDFTPANGEEWRTAMIALPVFAVRTAQGFYDQLPPSPILISHASYSAPLCPSASSSSSIIVIF